MSFGRLDLLQLQVIARVGCAMLLGALIGLEREAKDKPAGLRNHEYGEGFGLPQVEV